MKGAYTEDLVELLRKRDGWEPVGEAAHVNAPGYDRILRRGDIVRLVEAKARQALRLQDIKNLIRFDDVTGQIRFADDYFAQFGQAVDDAFDAGRLEVEIFLNSPDSSAIRTSLLQELGLPEGTNRILAKYEVETETGEIVERTVEVFLRAVSQ